MINKPKKLYLYIAAFIAITYSTLNYAIVDKLSHKSTSGGLHKLVEYNFFDLFLYTPQTNHEDFYFKDHHRIIASDLDSDGNIKLSTRVLSEDYKSFEDFHSSIKNPYQQQYKSSYLNLDTNKHVAFLTIEFEDDKKDEVNDKSLILKSTDGINWQDFSFGENFNSAYISNISDSMIVAHGKDTSSEYGTYKSIYSTDDGVTWQDFQALKNTPSGEYYSVHGIASTKVFFNNTVYDTGSKVTNFYVADITDPDAKLTKINFPDKIKTTRDGKDYELDFSFSSTVSELGNDLISKAYYSATTKDDKNEYISQTQYLLSKDNGMNWQVIDLKLDNQDIEHFYKKDDLYYLITMNDEEDDTSDDGDPTTQEEVEKFLLSQLNKSKIYIYTLTEEQLLRGSKFEPVLVLDKTAFFNSKDFPRSFSLSFIDNDQVKVGYFTFETS